MYNFKENEPKWQKFWEENKTFQTDVYDESKPKYYVLDMFPYPSGQGLHVGHPEGYTATDIVARFKRMRGYNVLHPMGWDAFGLPAEQYAIQTGNHPADFTKKNIAVFKKQIQSLGLSYDWDRELATTDPSYYKWTQWIFLKLYEKGLAYVDEIPVNWCPKLGAVLANEEVINGKSERGGYPVVRRPMRQWVLKITEYADRLLEDLDLVDWPTSTKEMQKNWIGKSEGANVIFKIDGTDKEFTVFTTRCDTLFGATYCVLAPEHPFVKEIMTDDKKEEVLSYIEDCAHKSDLERTDLNKEKTGVFTGAYAINPVNGKRIPIWISDYVLITYGTGAIMAVPAHDDRDYDFAKKFDLPIIQVLEEETGTFHENEKRKNSIVAVVYDEKKDKYLSINWHDKGGSLFIGGTIKEKESALECAKREIKEETGYTNIELVYETPKIFHHYYAYNKNTYFQIESTGFFFKLVGDKKEKQSLDEDEVFDVEWLSKEEVLDSIQDELHRKTFDYVCNKGAMTGDGIHIQSGFLDGLHKEEAIEKMLTYLEENGCGERKVQYKLRDWIFSRQRYWGEPIPIILMEDGTKRTVDISELPLELPDTDNYKPSETGESPLSHCMDFLEVEIDGMKGKRETNTMPQWAGSCWYYLRYIDPHNDKELCDPKLLERWLPVDLYVGGAEHAVLHLLYARFWHKVLYDCGVVKTKEPFQKLFHQGMILGTNNEKMSKSRGNVINPDDIVREYGADTLRLYEMFMGPLEADKPWSEQGVEGAKRFLDRVYRLLIESGKVKEQENPHLDKVYHQTVKKVTEDYETLGFNTAISQMMIFINECYKEEIIPLSYAKNFVKLLYPIAPHICEEMHHLLGGCDTITYEPWPIYDEEKIKEDTFEMVVQVNGKVRGKLEVDFNTKKDKMEKLALDLENVQKYIENKEVVKVVVIPKKLVNIVVK